MREAAEVVNAPVQRPARLSSGALAGAVAAASTAMTGGRVSGTG
jgi:hypothetical protein